MTKQTKVDCLVANRHADRNFIDCDEFCAECESVVNNLPAHGRTTCTYVWLCYFGWPFLFRVDVFAFNLRPSTWKALAVTLHQYDVHRTGVAGWTWTSTKHSLHQLLFCRRISSCLFFFILCVFIWGILMKLTKSSIHYTAQCPTYYAHKQRAECYRRPKEQYKNTLNTNFQVEKCMHTLVHATRCIKYTNKMNEEKKNKFLWTLNIITQHVVEESL